MHTPKYVIGKGETPTPASAEDDTEQANSSNFFKLRTAAGEYVVQVQKPYTLYLHMMLFFANGGGPCYIVSVGSYGNDLKKDLLANAIDTLKKESEPTMVVIPEATNLQVEDCYALQQAMGKPLR